MDALADALYARVDVLGLDCFTDYYARDIKEGNLAPLCARGRTSRLSRTHYRPFRSIRSSTA